MMELLDLRQTLDRIAACNDEDEVFNSFGWVHATDGPLLTARFWLPASEEAAFDDDHQVPAAARALGLAGCLEPATFADVLDVQKRQQPLSTVADYAHALAHYSEMDAFLELEGVDDTLGDADTAAQQAARAVGVGRGIFASFDLVLATCADDQIKAVAQRVARLLNVPVGEALARCRHLPLALGEGLDRQRAQVIVADFASIGVPLQVTGWKPFPWMDTPTLG